MVTSQPSSDVPALVVANARAARIGDPGTRARLLDRTASAVAARTGIPPRIVEAPGRSTLEAAIAAAVEARAPMVVVVGGDGTMRLAARILERSGIPLGIVPAGTGNLLAAALRIPRSPARAAAALATLPTRSIDLGAVAIHEGLRADVSDDFGVRFTVACGAGFDADVIAATSLGAKRRLGVGAYFAAAARLLGSLRPITFQIEVDGVALETEGVAALVANCGDLVPGLLRPRIPLDPADGLLELLVIRAASALGGARATFELLVQRPRHPAGVPPGRSLRIRGRHISIRADRPVALEVDGDPYPAGWFTARVLPGALCVLAPSPPRETAGGPAKQPA